MARPIQARVSPAALRHNYAAARAAAPASRVMAVVKANAYGHGLDRVARALADADGFGLVELEGAIRLRELGYRGTILLLEGFFSAGELALFARHGLATVVHHEEQLALLESARPVPPLEVWLKVNTGMNRLGFRPERVRPALERLAAPGVARSITLMTHFADSDLPHGVDEAMRRFESCTRGHDWPRSLANTAALFAHPGTQADIARLGIGLYGATPFADRTAEALGLQPAMALTSALIAVQDLQAGETVGYGSTFRAERPMRIGVVACGYADGYPRHAPSGTPVLVGDSLTRTAGRVSMDMMTVDLSAVPGARVGTPVTLWGPGLPVDQVAAAAGTVGYELLCAVAPRVPFVEG